MCRRDDENQWRPSIQQAVQRVDALDLVASSATREASGMPGHQRRCLSAADDHSTSQPGRRRARVASRSDRNGPGPRPRGPSTPVARGKKQSRGRTRQQGRAHPLRHSRAACALHDRPPWRGGARLKEGRTGEQLVQSAHPVTGRTSSASRKNRFHAAPAISFTGTPARPEAVSYGPRQPSRPVRAPDELRSDVGAGPPDSAAPPQQEQNPDAREAPAVHQIGRRRSRGPHCRCAEQRGREAAPKDADHSWPRSGIPEHPDERGRVGAEVVGRSRARRAAVN